MQKNDQTLLLRSKSPIRFKSPEDYRHPWPSNQDVFSFSQSLIHKKVRRIPLVPLPKPSQGRNRPLGILSCAQFRRSARQCDSIALVSRERSLKRSWVQIASNRSLWKRHWGSLFEHHPHRIIPILCKFTFPVLLPLISIAKLLLDFLLDRFPSSLEVLDHRSLRVSPDAEWSAAIPQLLQPAFQPLSTQSNRFSLIQNCYHIVRRWSPPFAKKTHSQTRFSLV